MAFIQSDQDREHKLKKLHELSLSMATPHSIEVPSKMSGSDPYLTYWQNTWDAGSTAFVEGLCEKYGLDYKIVPLDGKLVVTLR